jgi:hypothetical protein
MFVPAIGHIFPAITRNGVGPLSTHSSSAGGGVGARAGHLQPRGTTLPGGTSASRASGQDVWPFDRLPYADLARNSSIPLHGSMLLAWGELLKNTRNDDDD